MRVLVAHCEYRNAGGEEAVLRHEAEILSQHGVCVQLLICESGRLDALSAWEKLCLGVRFWNHALGRRLLRLTLCGSAEGIDVVHFHNLYPMLGPGAVRQAKQCGAGVVQTLHNYRLSCLAGTHVWEGSVCEACKPGRFMRGVLRGCYRGSRIQSALMAVALTRQWRDILSGVVDVTIVLTDFMREKYLGYGLPSSRVVVKQNSVARNAAPPPIAMRSGVVFAGRISLEKGILQLARSWAIDAPPFEVIGSGPLDDELATSMVGPVTIRGRLRHEETVSSIARARVLALPSVWYEGLPVVLLEALAAGVPVVAFDLGAMRLLGEIDRFLLVPAGDFEQLRARIEEVCSMPLPEYEILSHRCIRLYEDRFSPEIDVIGLIGAYDAAIDVPEDPTARSTYRRAL